jgi:MoxR-like ATPases
MKSNEKMGRFLSVICEINVPGLIMSSPGLGKTTVMKHFSNVAKDAGMNLTTLIASQYAPDDILGIQSVSEGRLTRLSPFWYNDLMERASNKKPNLLFIDEITTCDQFLQAPLLNLIFERSLGAHKLPENTYIVAAGNYADQLGGYCQLMTPTINRFLILNLNNENPSYKDISMNLDSMSEKETRAFLGLNSKKPSESEIQEILTSIEIDQFFSKNLDFSRVSFTNSSEEGLTGFTSFRSTKYCHQFLHEYLRQFGDTSIDLLCNVIGSSLGQSKSKLKIDTLLASHINSSLSKKKIDLKANIKEIEELIESVRKSGVVGSDANKSDKSLGESFLEKICSLGKDIITPQIELIVKDLRKLGLISTGAFNTFNAIRLNFNFN